ncbi:MAG: hypothetical protein DRZ82_10260 [Thermoprotei archaeon]|nr:MAG: hypothetical protein DRZ82_10260 [Thermoprotei archaeon]
MSRFLVVTQCCKRKCSIELFPNLDVSILNSLSDSARDKLLHARRIFNDKVYGTRAVTALSLYVGHEYEVLDKRLIYELYLKGIIDFIVISAGYGVVHAFEKIREYEAYMDQKTTRAWMKLGLPSIIADYIANTSPKEVYGFFSKTTGYQEIYREVVKHVPRNVETKIYIIYPESCRGMSNIMKALGQAINNLIKEGSISQRVNQCSLAIERLK